MSAKQLTRLVVALVVALGLWGAFAFARRSHTDRDTGFALPTIDTSAVDTMAFLAGPDSIVAVRRPDAGWRVNGHPAATSMVDQALAALVDTSDWSELAAHSTASEAAMGVSADSGQRVRIAVKGGRGLDLVTGHHTGDGTGVFIRRPSDSAVYALHGPLSQAVGHTLTDWRDKTVVSVLPDSIRRVEIEHRGTHYALVRAGRDWRLTSGAVADSQAVAQLLGRFHPLSATGFATRAQADSLHFSHPVARVTMYAGRAAPVVDLAFDSTNAYAWARADSGATVYEIESWRLDELVPAEKTLRKGTTKAR